MTSPPGTRSITREVPLDSLVVDPLLAELFNPEPDTIARIARSMRADGFDPHRPIDVWKDGAGRGRHVVVEGHQRLEAARLAGLPMVRIAFRHFANADDALMWSAEQQTNRRNASKESQCLSLLRALERRGQMTTTVALAERFDFSTATIDRARQVLARGTDSEVLAVMEGQHGLRVAYGLILKRERAAAEPLPADPPPAPAAPDPEPEELEEEEEPDDEARRWLGEMRALLETLEEAVDQARDLYDCDLRHVLGSTREHRTVLVRDIYEATLAIDNLPEPAVFWVKP